MTDKNRDDEKVNFLSGYAIAHLEIGLAIELETMIAPGSPGPDLRFLVAPEQADELGRNILAAVEDWRKTRRQ